MKRVGQPEERVIPYEDRDGVRVDEAHEETPTPEPVQEDAAAGA